LSQLPLYLIIAAIAEADGCVAAPDEARDFEGVRVGDPIRAMA
jgi:hypothetical protein